VGGNLRLSTWLEISNQDCAGRVATRKAVWPSSVSCGQSLHRGHHANTAAGVASQGVSMVKGVVHCAEKEPTHGAIYAAGPSEPAGTFIEFFILFLDAGATDLASIMEVANVTI
jgi:hypothetical protein